LTAHGPACRSCGFEDLRQILSLGSTPLANALLTAEQLGHDERRYPLELAFCSHCSLVQITEIIPPERLFSDYLYFSSFSETMLRHAREMVEDIVGRRHLNSDSLVIEIASNDGYLLRNLVEIGVPVLGVEPARNIATVAEERGVPTRCDFFSAQLAEQLSSEGMSADVIVANNVMAHVPDINGVVSGIKALLKPNGIFVMETPYVVDMIDGVEFDTIYHEHVFYYSLTALERLFQRHGLAALDVQRIPIHGGSLRITAGHATDTGARGAVVALLESEQARGVTSLEYYAQFADRVQRLRSDLHAVLEGLQAGHRRIAAYGASAKGSTLLNYFDIGSDTIAYVVDRSTVKQGRFTPGTHLQIFPTERLVQDRPDYVLLLTWNFADEILEQQAAYRRLGGRFIIPLPQIRVV